jgi:hypothetical protein
LTATGILVGCGGSSGHDSTQSSSTRQNEGSPVSRASRAHYVDQAETICARGIGETRAVGAQLPERIAHAPTPEAGIDTGLVKPGIEILDREATSLRSLEPRPKSSQLEIFLGLYDPIIALANERLKAGLAHEPQRARSIELLIASLSEEQSVAARRFGFHACAVGFTRALRGST